MRKERSNKESVVVFGRKGMKEQYNYMLTARNWKTRRNKRKNCLRKKAKIESVPKWVFGRLEMKEH